MIRGGDDVIMIENKVHSKQAHLDVLNISPTSPGPWKNCLHETSPWCQRLGSTDPTGPQVWAPFRPDPRGGRILGEGRQGADHDEL